MFQPAMSACIHRLFGSRACSAGLTDPCRAACTVGVPHPARFACLGNWSNRSEPSSLGLMSAPLSFQSLVVVVTQPASCACVWMFAPPSRPCVPAPVLLLLCGVLQPACAAAAGRRSVPCDGPPFGPSCWHGVGQPLSDEPQSLSDVRRTDARSAQICRPNGVARCFHVRLYSVEPSEAVLARNLLSKDDWRMALADEPMKLGPEVTLVVEPLAFARCTERLARAGASPDGSVVRPSGETEGVGPDADPGEEVALGVALEVARSHVPN